MASLIVNKIEKRNAKKKDVYIPHVYFCDKEDPNAIRNTIEKNKFAEKDLTISIGMSMTEQVFAISNDIGGLPTLFVGVPNPVELGVIKSLEKPGGYMSGVRIEKVDPHLFAQEIKMLHPHVTDILIIYNPESFKGYFKENYQNIFENLKLIGFNIDAQKTKSATKAESLLYKKIEAVQAILLLEGCELAPSISGKIAYVAACTERFYISTTGERGIHAGAPIAYGCDDDVLLNPLIDQMDAYLIKRKSLGALPVITLPANTRKLYINKFMLPWTPRPLFKELVKKPNAKVLFQWIECPIKTNQYPERQNNENNSQT